MTENDSAPKIPLSLPQKVLYGFLYAFLYLHSLLPMRVLYVLSDILYLLVYRVVGYRRKMVRKNMADCFPERSREELLKAEIEFYHWFCDYIVETIKLTTISEDEMRRRMKFEGLEEFESAVAQGKSCTVYLGHFCNWEWVSSIGVHLPSGAYAGQIYHELESPALNNLFLKIRGRFKVNNIRMDKTFQTLHMMKGEGCPVLVGYISDQAPGFNDMHCWPWFLNHDTPVYTGPEKMARLMHTPVFYLDITRPQRGHYVGRVVKICDDASQTENFFPTLEFFRLLEDSIKRNPGLWLWSHNRWKRTREQFNAHFTEEQRKRILARP